MEKHLQSLSFSGREIEAESCIDEKAQNYDCHIYLAAAVADEGALIFLASVYVQDSGVRDFSFYSSSDFRDMPNRF
jgi:hypothetical protein